MRLVEVVLGDDPDAWRRAGFAVDGDGTFVVGDVELSCTGEGEGVLRWALAADDPGARPPAGQPGDTLDGLPTSWVPAAVDAPARPGHANGVVALDHVVVWTPHRRRTVEVLGQRLGLEPRRETRHELQGRAMVQTFFVLPPTVVEVISRPDGEGDGGDGPASFRGLAFTTEDLDAAKELLGPALTTPRDAVQPGRRIASLMHVDLGLSLPVALLTPRPPRTA